MSKKSFTRWIATKGQGLLTQMNINRLTSQQNTMKSIIKIPKQRMYLNLAQLTGLDESQDLFES